MKKVLKRLGRCHISKGRFQDTMTLGTHSPILKRSPGSNALLSIAAFPRGNMLEEAGRGVMQLEKPESVPSGNSG